MEAWKPRDGRAACASRSIEAMHDCIIFTNTPLNRQHIRVRSRNVMLPRRIQCYMLYKTNALLLRPRRDVWRCAYCD
jgi:hypothetical protein